MLPHQLISSKQGRRVATRRNSAALPLPLTLTDCHGRPLDPPTATAAPSLRIWRLL